MVVPGAEMIKAGTDTTGIARIVSMRTWRDGQLWEFLLDQLCKLLSNKDIAFSRQVQSIVQIFGPRLIGPGCCVLHIFPQDEMGDVQLIGNLGSSLGIFAGQLKCSFELSSGLVAISLDLVLETTLMVDGRGADDDDLDVMANMFRDGTGYLLEIVLEALQGDVMPRIKHGVRCVVGPKEDGGNANIHWIVITSEDVLLSLGRIEIVDVPLSVVP